MPNVQVPNRFPHAFIAEELTARLNPQNSWLAYPRFHLPWSTEFPLNSSSNVTSQRLCGPGSGNRSEL